MRRMSHTFQLIFEANSLFVIFVHFVVHHAYIANSYAAQ